MGMSQTFALTARQPAQPVENWQSANRPRWNGRIRIPPFDTDEGLPGRGVLA